MSFASRPAAPAAAEGPQRSLDSPPLHTIDRISMQNFIDLAGASGARYRFRLWPDGAAHSPIAGNYVIVEATPERLGVLKVGATNNLAQVRTETPGIAARGTIHIFTRLNVARAERLAQHADIAAAHPAASATQGVD
jgi:hypothetical protein